SNSAGSVTSATATVTIHVPPLITTHPAGTTVVAGSSLNLSVVATGTPAPTYQWRKNGAVIPGATAATSSIASVQPADAGGYSVVVSNSAGSVTSATATIAVNVPPHIVTPPAAKTILAGETFSLTVVATGAPEPVFQWRKNGVDIPGATGTTFSISSAQPADAGNYSVIATNVGGSVTSIAAPVTVNHSRLVNLSARGVVLPGGALTAGFAIRGPSGKQLVLRGIGPTLTAFSVGGALDKAKLDIIAEGATVPLASNNGWGGLSALVSAFNAVGAFALASDSQDSAANINLPPGSYSVRVMPAGLNPSGIALAEIYDADSAITLTRLVNVSTLGFAGNGEQTLSVGFAVRGNVAKRVLIRAIGPGLSAYGVPNLLADPRLQVAPLGQEVISASNDDWAGTAALKMAFQEAGAFELADTSKDAALVVTLPPDGYTVTISGAGNATGNALIEIYDLDR
ncbi:MAG: immunoglobulin domain-containing protein, partial [Opitutaceae bacterium]